MMDLQDNDHKRALETAINRVTEAACVYPAPEQWEPDDLTEIPDRIVGVLEVFESSMSAIDSVALSNLEHPDPMIRHDARVIYLLGWTLRSELRRFPSGLRYTPVESEDDRSAGSSQT